MSWSEVKKINSDPMTPLNEGGVKIVKSVQRGRLSIVSNPNSVKVNINPVDMNKAIVFISLAVSNPNETYSVSFERIITSANISSSTQIEFYVGMINTSYTRIIDWQVIEFY